MSLHPLHEHLARLTFSLPEATDVAIAGGNAMLAHGLVERPTQDLDLFTPDESEIHPLTIALIEALHAEGAIVEADRRGSTFIRLAVTMPDGQSVAVEIAQDARIRSATQLSFGRVLAQDEVAADKTLALFGRAAARDLVDVAALMQRYPLAELCRLAGEKDPGFERAVLADAFRAAASHPASAFTELGLSEGETEKLKAGAVRWRTQILSEDAQAGPATAHPPEQ